VTFETHAAVMERPGDPAVLKLKKLPLAWPGRPNQVLVRLRAAGINPADTFFRALGPYLGDGTDCVLGHDGAGVVEAVGAEVTKVKPGDPVCFCHGGIGGAPGTYAHHAVVPERLLVAKPANVSFEEAAALPLVFITAWESLAERAQVKAGERVLIHAGAGGTGQIAIQVARHLGGRVAATVSSEDKARRVAELGAERPILYRDEDFVAAARSWTEDRGLDVALDNVGPETLRRTFEAMAVYGRVVTLMGLAADTDDTLAYNRNLTLHNVMMLTPMWQGMSARMAVQADYMARGMALLGDGKIEVEVAECYDLESVADAHRRLEAGGSSGKIVLTMPNQG
jgi:NADPH2:quinone reductase